MFASPAAQSLRGDTGYPALTAVVPASVYGETNPGFSKNVFDNKFSSFPSSAPVFGENFASFADAGALQPGMSPDVVTVHVEFPYEQNASAVIPEGMVVFLYRPKITKHHGRSFLSYQGLCADDKVYFMENYSDRNEAGPIFGGKFVSFFCGVLAGSVSLKKKAAYVPLAYQNTVNIHPKCITEEYLTGDRFSFNARYRYVDGVDKYTVTFETGIIKNETEPKYTNEDGFVMPFLEAACMLDTSPKTASMELCCITRNPPYLSNYLPNVNSGGAITPDSSFFRSPTRKPPGTDGTTSSSDYKFTFRKKSDLKKTGNTNKAAYTKSTYVRSGASTAAVRERLSLGEAELA